MNVIKLCPKNVGACSPGHTLEPPLEDEQLHRNVTPVTGYIYFSRS